MTTPMQMFNVWVQVPRDSVGLVIDVLNGTGKLVNVWGIEDEAPVPARRTGYKNGLRNKGVKGEDLLLSLIKDKPATRAAINRAFAAKHFADNTASAIISRLRADGVVAWVDDKLEMVNK